MKTYKDLFKYLNEFHEYNNRMPTQKEIELDIGVKRGSLARMLKTLVVKHKLKKTYPNVIPFIIV
jgi:DNA-binding MarR family transcriptional regulator